MDSSDALAIGFVAVIALLTVAVGISDAVPAGRLDAPPVMRGLRLGLLYALAIAAAVGVIAFFGIGKAIGNYTGW